jgi:hypothetical protein
VAIQLYLWMVDIRSGYGTVTYCCTASISRKKGESRGGTKRVNVSRPHRGHIGKSIS